MSEHLEKKIKVCTQCKTPKSIDEFYKCKTYRLSECKACMIKRANKYRKEHIKEYRAYKKKYRDKNSEKWSKYAKTYQAKHAKRISLAVSIHTYLRNLKKNYNIDLGRFSIRGKTNKELEEKHAQLKELYKRKRKGADMF